MTAISLPSLSVNQDAALGLAMVMVTDALGVYRAQLLLCSPRLTACIFTVTMSAL